MHKGKISPQETFQLHEILTIKNVGATKASVMRNLVKDEELSMILEQDFKTSQEQIKELQALIQLSTFQAQ